MNLAFDSEVTKRSWAKTGGSSNSEHEIESEQ